MLARAAEVSCPEPSTGWKKTDPTLLTAFVSSFAEYDRPTVASGRLEFLMYRPSCGTTRSSTVSVVEAPCCPSFITATATTDRANNPACDGWPFTWPFSAILLKPGGSTLFQFFVVEPGPSGSCRSLISVHSYFWLPPAALRMPTYGCPTTPTGSWLAASVTRPGAATWRLNREDW